MTVKEILALEPSELSALKGSDLRAALRTVANAGNKRLKRLEDAGLSNSPAALYIREHGGAFTYSKKILPDDKTARREFDRALNFIKAKTSSIPTAREYQEKVNSFLAEHARIALVETTEDGSRIFDKTAELTDEQQKKFWRVWSRFKERAEYKSYYQKSRVQNTITQFIIKHPDEIPDAGDKSPDWTRTDKVLDAVLKRAYEESEAVDISDVRKNAPAFEREFET